MKQKQISRPHNQIIPTDTSYVLGAMPHTLIPYSNTQDTHSGPNFTNEETKSQQVSH